MSEVVNNVLTEVSGRIKDSNQEVRTRVVNSLVEREVSKRADTLDKALAKYKELTNNSKRSKPDQVAFDAAGAKVETYSKAKFEEKQKNDQRLKKLSDAIDAALNNGEFGKLTEVLNKVSKGDDSDSQDTSTTEE